MADRIPVRALAHYKSYNPGETFYVGRAELQAELATPKPRLRAATVDEIPRPAAPDVKAGPKDAPKDAPKK